MIASTPSELAERLALLRSWIESGQTSGIDLMKNVFLGTESTHPMIGFLFPGQGSPAHLDGGVLRRRFEEVDALYRRASLPKRGDGVSTDIRAAGDRHGVAGGSASARSLRHYRLGRAGT